MSVKPLTQNVSPKNYTEVFELKEKPPIGDFLFILDNSSSMQTKIDNIRQSLRDIPLNRYPQNSLLAVMTTMTSRYDNFNLTHPGINVYGGIESEPGFLSFVNKQQIDSYLANSNVPKIYKDKYSIEGCRNSWFRPDEKNAKGNRCFEAAMQSALHGVGCEAGLNAFEQLLIKNKNKPIFRAGSYVHVIHVSDERHPGCDNSEILEKVPNYKTLRDSVFANSKVNGFKIHGIGTDDNSSKVGTTNYPVSVRKRSEDSNGIYLLMNANSYANVIENILSSGKYEKMEFNLKYTPIKIKEVKINNIVTNDYVIKSNKIEINKVDIEKNNKITIEYEIKN